MDASAILAGLGVIIIVAILFDIIVTTISMDGAGPLSRRLTTWIWGAFRMVRRMPDRPLLSSSVGPATLVVLLLFWFGATWLGWWLFLGWDEIMIVQQRSGKVASPVEKFYYSGTSITAIGYGDYIATGSLGRAASVASGFNGLFLFTLGITYYFQVLTAMVHKRRLALMINCILDGSAYLKSAGGQSADWVEQTRPLELAFAGISQSYLAYPVIHYYHDPSPDISLSRALYRLHCALQGSDESAAEYTPKEREQMARVLTLVRIIVRNALLGNHSSSSRRACIVELVRQSVEAESEGEKSAAMEKLLRLYWANE